MMQVIRFFTLFCLLASIRLSSGVVDYTLAANEVVIEISDDEPDDAHVSLSTDSTINDAAGTRLSEQCIDDISNSDQWLSGDILNACIRLINNKTDSHDIKKPSRQVVILETDFYQTIRRNSNNHIMSKGKYDRWLNKQSLSITESAYLVIPVGTDLHWLLVAINLNKQQIEVYNSLKEEGIEDIKIVSEWWEWYSFERGITISFSQIDYHEIQQTNLSDCGVFTIMSMAALSCNKPVIETLKESGLDGHWLTFRGRREIHEALTFQDISTLSPISVRTQPLLAEIIQQEANTPLPTLAPPVTY